MCTFPLSSTLCRRLSLYLPVVLWSAAPQVSVRCAPGHQLTSGSFQTEPCWTHGAQIAFPHGQPVCTQSQCSFALPIVEGSYFVGGGCSSLLTFGQRCRIRCKTGWLMTNPPPPKEEWSTTLCTASEIDGSGLPIEWADGVVPKCTPITCTHTLTPPPPHIKFGPKSHWVVSFFNGQDGPHCNSPIPYMTRCQIKCRDEYFLSSPEGSKVYFVKFL